MRNVPLEAAEIACELMAYLMLTARGGVGQCEGLSVSVWAKAL